MGQQLNKKTSTHLVVQGLSAMVFMYVVLIVLDDVARSTIIWAAGASSLASSAYIIFCAPHSKVAHPYKIIIGYLIAILSGGFLRYLAQGVCFLLSSCHYDIAQDMMFELAAALSVGLALFLMILFRSEHPPAAGLAVVMVLDIRNVYALAIILVAAIVLAIIRKVFAAYLCNLVSE